MAMITIRIINGTEPTDIHIATSNDVSEPQQTDLQATLQTLVDELNIHLGAKDPKQDKRLTFLYNDQVVISRNFDEPGYAEKLRTILSMLHEHKPSVRP